MSGNVIVITDDSMFPVELANAESKLVVVDFTASWCGPCQRIAPVFNEFSRKYRGAVFLKVDVDQCQQTAGSYGIRAMPTFVFLRNKVKIDSMSGADPNALEEKIKKWVGGEDAAGGGESSSTFPGGHLDLSSFINKSGSECLNDSDDHPFTNCLNSNPGYLESDCDEQLIISVTFNQAIKLFSIKIEAPSENGPKTVKVFSNQTRSLDFDSADSMEPVQTLSFTEDDVSQGNPQNVRFVKFQNVLNITLFIKDNLGGTEITRIDKLQFIGSPVATTNMSDFKRIAGKQGESH